jgi:hypothetical protein
MSASFDRFQRKNRSGGSRRQARQQPSRQHPSIAPSLRARQEQGIDQQIWFLHHAMVEVIIAEPWRIEGLLARIDQYYQQGQLRHGAYLFWHSALTSAQLTGVTPAESLLDNADSNASGLEHMDGRILPDAVANKVVSTVESTVVNTAANTAQADTAPQASSFTIHQSVTTQTLSAQGADLLRSTILAFTPQAEKYRRKTMLIGVLTEAQRQAAIERACQHAFFPEPAI